MQRIEREKLTIAKMVRLYCRLNHHPAEELCPQCGELLEYARGRLGKCPHGNRKPTCQRCPIHCYTPSRREEIRRVMRFAGPRMLLYHPIAAIRHLLN